MQQKKEEEKNGVFVKVSLKLVQTLHLSRDQININSSFNRNKLFWKNCESIKLIK